MLGLYRKTIHVGIRAVRNRRTYGDGQVNKMPYDKDTMRACVYGLAVGDALGVPYEFLERGTFVCNDMATGGVHDQPLGTWSDDTSMTLCICESVKRLGHVDADDIACNFRRWLRDGDFTCDGRVFDVGITCREAIETGRPSESFRACGNGSLMRTAPIAMLRDWSDKDVKAVSAITHAHPVAEWSCVALCEILGVLKEHSRAGIDEVWQRYGFIAALPRDEVKSGGYCVHTLAAAIWCLCNTSGYRDCVLAAVDLGDDSDTTAAVAGALAGVAYGYDAIPPEWLDQLRGKAVIERCI